MGHIRDTSKYRNNPERATRTAYSCLALFVRAILSQIKSRKLTDFEGCVKTLKDLQITYENLGAVKVAAVAEEGPVEVAEEHPTREEEEEERAWRAVLDKILREAREITSNATGLYGHTEAVAKMKDLPSLLLAKTSKIT